MVSPEVTHAQLVQLMMTFPTFDGSEVSNDSLRWLGRLYASAQAQHEIQDADDVKFQMNCAAGGQLPLGRESAKLFYGILCRLLGHAELKLSPSAQGVFIGVGDSYDALAAVRRILQRATAEVLIVDPYMDGGALEQYAAQAADGIAVRLMADMEWRKPGLAPVVDKWIKQHGSQRPVQARLTPRKSLHDRAIFVDSREVWAVSQSFNALATRSPATILRLDEDTAALKIEAYADLWDRSSPLT